MSGENGACNVAAWRDEGTYCMRCKARRPLADARRVTLRNGRPVLKGRCPICDAPLFRIAGRVRRDGA